MQSPHLEQLQLLRVLLHFESQKQIQRKERMLELEKE
jgi:hypothetical protein